MDLQMTPVWDRLDEVYIMHHLLPSHILCFFYLASAASGSSFFFRGRSGCSVASRFVTLNLAHLHIKQEQGVDRLGGRNSSKSMLFHRSRTVSGTTASFLAAKSHLRHCEQTPFGK